MRFTKGSSHEYSLIALIPRTTCTQGVTVDRHPRMTHSNPTSSKQAQALSIKASVAPELILANSHCDAGGGAHLGGQLDPGICLANHGPPGRRQPPAHEGGCGDEQQRHKQARCSRPDAHHAHEQGADHQDLQHRRSGDSNFGVNSPCAGRTICDPCAACISGWLLTAKAQ